MKLCVYQKKDGLTPPALLPDEKSTDPDVIELCELDGKTYVSVSDEALRTVMKSGGDLVEVSGATMAEEMPSIVAKIKSSAPAVKDIRAEVIRKIREKYSVDDEIYLLRTAPSPETAAWNDYVENCRQWGREQKALLGL